MEPMGRYKGNCPKSEYLQLGNSRKAALKFQLCSLRLQAGGRAVVA